MPAPASHCRRQIAPFAIGPTGRPVDLVDHAAKRAAVGHQQHGRPVARDPLGRAADGSGDPRGDQRRRLDALGRPLLLDPGSPGLGMQPLALRARESLEDAERPLAQIGVDVRHGRAHRRGDDLGGLARAGEIARDEPREPLGRASSRRWRAPALDRSR